MEPIRSTGNILACLNLEPRANLKDSVETTLEVDEATSILSFLDLPREIRDEIYSLVFLSPNMPVYPSKARAGPISEAINLLRTNRQIYSEAVETLYGQNMFQIRGHPAYMAPDFLNLVIFRRRKDEMRAPLRAAGPDHVCLARHCLRKLSIPSHGISLDRLKHLFSLLKYFPKLEHVQVIYLGKRGLNDMEIVNVCRLLRDRLPLLKTFVLGKRISYAHAEDISWMVSERPYGKWESVDDGEVRRQVQEVGDGHMWRNEQGENRRAKLFQAPQNIPE